MSFNDLQKKTDAELQKLVSEKREELRTLRFQAAGGAMTDVKAFRAAKKDIAHALTELNARTVSAPTE